MTRRFWWAYAILAHFLIAMFTVGAIAWVFTDPGHVVYATSGTKPITNKSAPIDVQNNFAEGQEYSQFSATAVQMRDGTCYAYTNKVSWLAMECFGAVQR